MVKLITPTESLVKSNQTFTEQWNALPESEANLPILTSYHGKHGVASVSVVRCDGRYYFVTANHCLDTSNQQKILLEASSDVDVEIDKWCRSDIYDIAFIRLTGEVEQYIVEQGKYMEIPNTRVLIELSTQPRHFFMAGFPQSKNKIIKNKKKVGRYITYLLERTDLLTGDSIFCSFDKENYFDEVGNSIQRHHQPAGNSGGPLIYVTSFEGALTQENANFVFSGILLEANKSEKVLKFASAILLRNILKQEYDSL